MTLAIMYKEDKLEIYDDVNVLDIENGNLTFNISKIEHCSTVPLANVAKVSVNGVVYYDAGEVKI